MRTYYRFPDEYTTIPDAVTYWEVDAEQWYVVRAITTNGTQVMASNRPYLAWGFCLPDKTVDPADLVPDGIIPVDAISEATFNQVWDTQRAIFQTAWEASKVAYPVGTHVEGWIELFYPQGMIVNLDDGVYGVADYAEAQASAPPMTLYGGYRVTAVVVGYDEVNQWLMVGQPQVGPEQTHIRTGDGWIRHEL